MSSPDDIIVGGIGAILKPDYIRENVRCRVIDRPLDKEGILEEGVPAISNFVPDYGIIDSVHYDYKPEDLYFCRVTTGCIRHCDFCAVPKLEPKFGFLQSVKDQITEVQKRFGERQHLVLMDNNILALKKRLSEIIAEIRKAGFEAGAIRNGRQRTVDLNQGIDARLIDQEVSKMLSTICLSPIRLAFDHDDVEDDYRRAINHLAEAGFTEFTNYVMFNYNDTPESLYRRLKVNTDLSSELGIKVTGFPMRYIPIDDITRRYVSPGWRWRYLRGIQCVLLATHGMVSPNPVFFAAAFGNSVKEFEEIISMPDRYIIHRKKHTDNGASEWKSLFTSLTPSEKEEFLSLLQKLNGAPNRKSLIAENPKYRDLFDHYYPGGNAPHDSQFELVGLEAVPVP